MSRGVLVLGLLCVLGCATVRVRLADGTRFDGVLVGTARADVCGPQGSSSSVAGAFTGPCVHAEGGKHIAEVLGFLATAAVTILTKGAF